jgi:hypothetical protein
VLICDRRKSAEGVNVYFDFSCNEAHLHLREVKMITIGTPLENKSSNWISAVLPSLQQRALANECGVWSCLCLAKYVKKMDLGARLSCDSIDINVAGDNSMVDVCRLGRAHVFACLESESFLDNNKVLDLFTFAFAEEGFKS